MSEILKAIIQSVNVPSEAKPIGRARCGPNGRSLAPWREWIKDSELELYNKLHPSLTGIYQYDRRK